MEKLYELANARLDISIQKYDFQDMWKMTVSKDDDGINLRIMSEGETLEEVIADIYEKWTKATSRGVPSMRLNVLEHKPEVRIPPQASRSLDDEIPF